MKLRDLEAEFISNYGLRENGASYHRRQGDLMDGAQGVLFICPLCREESIICWFRNPINAPQVPDDAYPRPGRWTASGTGIADLTLSPSVNLDTQEAHESIAKGYHPCLWHGWVKDGDAS